MQKKDGRPKESPKTTVIVSAITVLLAIGLSAEMIFFSTVPNTAPALFPFIASLAGFVAGIVTVIGVEAFQELK